MYISHAPIEETEAQLMSASVGIGTQDLWSQFNSLSFLSHSHHTKKVAYKYIFCMSFSLLYFALDIHGKKNVKKFEYNVTLKSMKCWELKGRCLGYDSNLQGGHMKQRSHQLSLVATVRDQS